MPEQKPKSQEDDRERQRRPIHKSRREPRHRQHYGDQRKACYQLRHRASFPTFSQSILNEHLVHVAEPPIFVRLEGLDYGMLRFVEVLRGVLIFG